MLNNALDSAPVPDALKALREPMQSEQDNYSLTWANPPEKSDVLSLSRLEHEPVYPSRSISSLFRISLFVHKGHNIALVPQIDLGGSQRLESQLLMSFEETSIEDGINHPAEQILDEALHSADLEHVLAKLSELSLDISRPFIASSVLRCLGRRQPGFPEWRAELVRLALESNDVEIRDAAVQAADSWGGLGIINVLQRHTEETVWLRAYIDEIVENHLKE